MDNPKRFFKELPAEFSFEDDPAQRRLLNEYGAVFVARAEVQPPDRVVFKDDADVARFQSKLNITSSRIGAFTYELQSTAMTALLRAVDTASNGGLSINGRSEDSARRNYNDTITLWRSRVEPALIHWVRMGRMTLEKADGIRGLSPYEQVPEVFALEEEGIFFAKDLSKSIIYSVAPPGASQHLSMLAFDVAEFDNVKVRAILADHYWYQTVVSDLPHFTFLGVSRERLPELGLRSVAHLEREFWVPDI